MKERLGPCPECGKTCAITVRDTIRKHLVPERLLGRRNPGQERPVCAASGTQAPESLGSLLGDVLDLATREVEQRLSGEDLEERRNSMKTKAVLQWGHPLTRWPGAPEVLLLAQAYNALHSDLCAMGMFCSAHRPALELIETFRRADTPEAREAVRRAASTGE